MIKWSSFAYFSCVVQDLFAHADKAIKIDFLVVPRSQITITSILYCMNERFLENRELRLVFYQKVSALLMGMSQKFVLTH